MKTVFIVPLHGDDIHSLALGSIVWSRLCKTRVILAFRKHAATLMNDRNIPGMNLYV